MKEQLAKSFGNTLRDDLAAVDLAARLVTKNDVPAAERHDYGDLIHAKVEDAYATLHEVESFMIAELHGDYAQVLPIPVLPAIEEAITVVETSAADRGIEIKVPTASETSQVVGAPKLMPHVFDAILQFLLLDARDESELTVELEETAGEVHLTFRNDGFGAMTEAIRAFLFEDGESSIPEHQRLREALEFVREWNGQMNVTGEIGGGLTVTLNLQKFE
jgi:hypothetical protein